MHHSGRVWTLGCGSRWLRDQPNRAVYAPNLVFPALDVSADIYLTSSSSESSWQFATTGAGGNGFAGGIDVSGTSIIAITRNVSTVIGMLTRDTWHHVVQVVNYSLQTYAVKLDGTTLASGLAFCGNNSGTCNGAMVTAMGWDLFDSFGGGNDFRAMDNFSISTPVPEPGTLALLGFGSGSRAGCHAPQADAVKRVRNDKAGAAVLPPSSVRLSVSPQKYRQL